MIRFNPIKVVTPSTLEAVSLTEAKEHLRIDGDDQNSIVKRYVKAATERCENFMQSSIMSTEHELYSSNFDSGYSLQKYPVTAVNSVKYYDTDNALQTVASSNYRLQDFRQPCFLEFDTNFDVPDVYEREYPVVINFNAGYASASTVPSSIVLGILNELGDANEFRQNLLTGNGLTVVGIKDGTAGWLNPYTMWV